MKKALCVLLALCFLLACAACGGTPAESTPPSAPVSEAPLETSEQTPADTIEGVSDETLTIALASEPATTDTVYGIGETNGTISRHLYDTLINYDSESNEVVPMLAESWEYIDECTLRLYLHDDVYYHDGEKFTAEDVIWNLKNANENSSLGASVLANFDLDNCKVVDETTVDLVTFAPYYMGVVALTMSYMPMMSPSAVEAQGEDAYTRTPTGGSGAYKFVEWVPGDHITLERNEDYYGELPYYKTLVFKFISDSNARGLALQAGDVDVAEGVLEELALEIQSGTDYKLYMPQNSVTCWLMNFNCRENNILNDVRIRQAICYAIDLNATPEVSTTTLSSTVPEGLVPTSSVAFKESENGYYAYDLEKAKELMAEAGYPDGGFSLTLIHQENTVAAAIAEYVQYALSELGIDVKVESMTNAVCTERQNAGDYDLYFQRMTAFDPPNDVVKYYAQGSLNRTQYNNPEFDEWYVKLNQTMDEEEYYGYMEQLLDILNEEVPVYCLINNSILVGYRSDITGIASDKMCSKVYTGVRPVA